MVRSLLAVALLTSTASSAFNLYDASWWFAVASHGYLLFALPLVLALYACGAVLAGACNSGPDMATIRSLSSMTGASPLIGGVSGRCRSRPDFTPTSFVALKAWAKA